MLSVGSRFVNCRLQIGQGLVITYVMVVLPLARHQVVARRMPEKGSSEFAEIVRFFNAEYSETRSYIQHPT
jgi:hypothetical protein